MGANLTYQIHFAWDNTTKCFGVTAKYCPRNDGLGVSIYVENILDCELGDYLLVNSYMYLYILGIQPGLISQDGVIVPFTKEEG